MSPPPAPPTAFDDLGLRPELLAALESLGYEEPTPIQRDAIPVLLAGRDLVGQASTGTGKTAAFALPLLNDVRGGGRQPGALVLVPTRELAVQVSEAVHRYGRVLGARVLPLYGGAPIGRQLKSLQSGVDVVVATPGRALDHLARGTLHLDRVRAVVLDEADEMLDMGFAEDIDAILGQSPSQRQTILFSATIPPRIEAVARKHLRDPVRIRLGEASHAGDAPAVEQVAYVVRRADKPAALGRILDVEAPDAAIVFCRTRDEVDALTQTLNGRGYRAEALHGGISQDQREKVMGRLRAGTADLLVATDVAARGIDIDHLTHVINYNLPSDADSYVHRIGRVGRGGREGVAITLAEPREHRMLRTIERVTSSTVRVATLPSVADLQARRLEITQSAVLEALLSGDLDGYRVVVETLTDSFDVVEVALAAVKVVHETTSPAPDAQEIEDVVVRADRPEARRSDSARGPARDGGGEGRRGKAVAAGTGRVWIGLGRAAGVRPQDLVGAIAGESSLRGDQIGAIDISDRFSLVDVPEESVEEVVRVMKGATLRGRRPQVRRDRGGR